MGTVAAVYDRRRRQSDLQPSLSANTSSSSIPATRRRLVEAHRPEARQPAELRPGAAALRYEPRDNRLGMWGQSLGFVCELRSRQSHG
jgi:hypothetical protein